MHEGEAIHAMPRQTVLVERSDSLGDEMSPQGVMDLWEALVRADPRITGVVVELDADHDLPPRYEATVLDDREALPPE